jgi:fructosamine-3-kinase
VLYNGQVCSTINELIRHIVARYGGSLTDVVPIIGNGSVNRVFVATTERGKLVARLNADRGLDEFRKEAWCIEQAAARGVLGPAVLDVGQKDGYSYMVQSFLEGAVGSEGAIDHAAAWHTIGRNAKAIHAIQEHGFGLTLHDIQDRGFSGRWKRHVAYNVASLTPEDQLLALGALTPDQSPRVRARFRALLRQRFTFGLNHGDLSLKNVIVGTRGEVFLLDWGSAEAHVVPHHDIGEILKSSLERHSAEFDMFLAGYGLSAERYGEMEHDVHALMLLRAIDKLRWAIDRHPVDIPSMVDTVKSVYRLAFD